MMITPQKSITFDHIHNANTWLIFHYLYHNTVIAFPLNLKIKITYFPLETYPFGTIAAPQLKLSITDPLTCMVMFISVSFYLFCKFKSLNDPLRN